MVGKHESNRYRHVRERTYDTTQHALSSDSVWAKQLSPNIVHISADMAVLCRLPLSCCDDTLVSVVEMKNITLAGLEHTAESDNENCVCTGLSLISVWETTVCQCTESLMNLHTLRPVSNVYGRLSCFYNGLR